MPLETENGQGEGASKEGHHESRSILRREGDGGGSSSHRRPTSARRAHFEEPPGPASQAFRPTDRGRMLRGRSESDREKPSPLSFAATASPARSRAMTELGLRRSLEDKGPAGPASRASPAFSSSPAFDRLKMATGSSGGGGFGSPPQSPSLRYRTDSEVALRNFDLSRTKDDNAFLIRTRNKEGEDDYKVVDLDRGERTAFLFVISCFVLSLFVAYPFSLSSLPFLSLSARLSLCGSLSRFSHVSR